MKQAGNWHCSRSVDRALARDADLTKMTTCSQSLRDDTLTDNTEDTWLVTSGCAHNQASLKPPAVWD